MRGGVGVGGIKYILIVGQERRGSKPGKHGQDIVELFLFQYRPIYKSANIFE